MRGYGPSIAYSDRLVSLLSFNMSKCRVAADRARDAIRIRCRSTASFGRASTGPLAGDVDITRPQPRQLSEHTKLVVGKNPQSPEVYETYTEGQTSPDESFAAQTDAIMFRWKERRGRCAGPSPNETAREAGRVTWGGWYYE